MNLTNKKIGIWGYGVTGKAAVNSYLKKHNALAVLDQKTLPVHEQEFLHSKNIPLYTQDQLSQFLDECDYILPSPGIDLRAYDQYQSKWLNELDLFYATWHEPIIAITGSVGKTTVTHLLSILLGFAHKRIATGGNIGTPMFDLIAQQTESDYALLELSSFQLEKIKTFAPSLAILTNFYPNHLDRHGSEAEYLQAKAQLFAYQQPVHLALIPLEFKDRITAQSSVHYFLPSKPSDPALISLKPEQSVYYLSQNGVIKYKNAKHELLWDSEKIPAISYKENWLILRAALDLLQIPMPDVAARPLTLPEHRLEFVASHQGIDFYNDSKSTTPQSTLAAVGKLNSRPILLLLGGISKGIDRAPLIEQLHGKVSKIYCFGKEAEALKALCDAHHIPSQADATLDTAFAACVQDGKVRDQILLSPAGASFDLFAHYIERGQYFKKLVNDLVKK